MTTAFLKTLGMSSAALAVALAGCDNSRPGAGFTNPNGGSVTARDKASVRSDMPVPDANAGGREPVAEAASSSPSGTGSLAGGSGPGSGEPGRDKDARQTSPEAATSAPASPPKKDNTGSAAGATRPADVINTGTPRSPQ